MHAALTTGTETEHKLSLKEALRAYPTAVAWSVGVSFSIVMEGYDTQVGWVPSM